MKTTIKHLILWLFAAWACIMIGCKKEHPIDLDWTKKYQPKDGNIGTHPLPWKIVGWYYPRDPKAQNWYTLHAADSSVVHCIDRDLKVYYGK